MDLKVIWEMSTNITTTEHRVAEEARWRANGHRGGVLWFTGLSASGKTTLAFELEQRLFKKGYQVYVLDGDNIRHGLSADLGFSPGDRGENIRRIGEVAALFADAGYIVIPAFISPYRRDRELARQAAGGGKPFTPAPCKPPPSAGGGYVLHSRRPVPPWQAGRMVRRRTTIPGRSTRCLTKDSPNRNI